MDNTPIICSFPGDTLKIPPRYGTRWVQTSKRAQSFQLPRFRVMQLTFETQILCPQPHRFRLRSVDFSQRQLKFLLPSKVDGKYSEVSKL